MVRTPDVATPFLHHVVRVHGLPETLVRPAQAIGVVWHQGQPLFCLPPLDGWLDGEDEFSVEAILAHLHRLPADRLGQPLATGKNFI